MGAEAGPDHLDAAVDGHAQDQRLLWNGADPVYERAGESYRLMTEDRKAALAAEYAEHGRDQLLRF